jgi:glycosyltransferase involved in cell wall biosynthesis
MEKGSLLVFADDWGRHPSSCQHLVRRLVGSYRILWVNTIGTRGLTASRFTARRVYEKIRNWSKRFHLVHQNMWVVDVPMLPWTGNRICRTVNRRVVSGYLARVTRQLGILNPVVLTTQPHAGWLLGRLPRRGMIYYCTDDFSQWPSAEAAALERAESELCREADLVLAVSPELRAKNQAARRCELFPHGVDFEHFRQASRETQQPSSLKEIPRPRVGFFGLIYEKIDFSLLRHLAKENPDVHLALIGPIVACDDALRSMPNVHLLGRQPYDSLPQWIAGLDVLILPYVRDKMILQSNPLKLRECLATGKPLVSVDLPEARRFQPLISVARGQSEFSELVRMAISTPVSAADVAARQAAVRNDDWDARARQLEKWIDEVRGARPNANHEEPAALVKEHRCVAH